MHSALSVGGDKGDRDELLRENKRELLRRNLSGRASETFPNFQEEDQKEREREQQRSREEAEERSQEQGRKTRGMTLNASEEQVAGRGADRIFGITVTSIFS